MGFLDDIKNNQDLEKIVEALLASGKTPAEVTDIMLRLQADLPQAPLLGMSQLDRIVKVISTVYDKRFVIDLTALTNQDAVYHAAEVNKYYKLPKLISGWNSQEPMLQCVRKDATSALFTGTANYPGELYSLSATFLNGITDPTTLAQQAYIPYYIGAPTDAQHAATKAYVDGKAPDLSPIRFVTEGAPAVNHPISEALGTTPGNTIASMAYADWVGQHVVAPFNAVKVFDNETGVQVLLSSMDGSNTSKTLATQHHISKFGTIKVAQSAGAENNLGTLTGADTNNKLASQGYVDTHVPDLSAYKPWNYTVNELAARKFKRADGSVIGFTDINASGNPAVTAATVDYVDAKAPSKQLVVVFNDGSAKSFKVG